MSEIVNRVKESGLIQMDLAKYKPTQQLEGLDIADVLWERIALKEKEFRTWVKAHDWESYSNKAVYVFCSEDAIIPTWAYMLVVSKLNEVNCISIVGSENDLAKKLIKLNIEKEELTDLQDGRVIIKGCSDIQEPAYAMTELISHIQPAVKSIMYGEPCSTVPVYKRKK